MPNLIPYFSRSYLFLDPLQWARSSDDNRDKLFQPMDRGGPFASSALPRSEVGCMRPENILHVSKTYGVRDLVTRDSQSVNDM